MQHGGWLAMKEIYIVSLIEDANVYDCLTHESHRSSKSTFRSGAHSPIGWLVIVLVKIVNTSLWNFNMDSARSLSEKLSDI